MAAYRTLRVLGALALVGGVIFAVRHGSEAPVAPAKRASSPLTFDRSGASAASTTASAGPIPLNVEPRLRDIAAPEAVLPTSPGDGITPYPEPRPTLAVDAARIAAAPDPTVTAVSGASAQDAPAIEALRDLEKITEPSSSRIGGVVSRSPRPLGGKGAAATPSPNAVEVLGRVGGQTRGFMMLPLMHPRARPMVEAQIDTLLRAQIQQIYVGVLVEGTFSLDLDYLNAVIERLNAGERELTLVLYFVSGPTMRDYDTTPIKTAFSRINPTDFRALVMFDQQTRFRFESIVNRMKPALVLNRSLKPTNRSIAVVMLEDNLDAESYRTMRASAEFVLGSDVEFVRNPCPRCWPGNDDDPQGDGVELHAPASPLRLGRRDGYVMDGRGYVFPGERKLPGEYSIEETFGLIDATMARGVGYFGLWRARRQGIVNGVLVHPDERVYEVPTLEQSEIEIQLLRHGLIPRDEPQ